MADVAEMIAALGGVRKTGVKLGLAPTTVQHWKQQNRAPNWRIDTLRHAYEHRNAPPARKPTRKSQTVTQ